MACAVAGSVWGQDDAFPFGPFRMYSTTTPPSGSVFVPSFTVITEKGREVRAAPSDVGLRVAEVMGQIDRIRDHPELLRNYAEAFERRHPNVGAVVKLELVYEVHRLEEGRPVSSEQRTMVKWSRA
jgi:hypothetical protein